MSAAVPSRAELRSDCSRCAGLCCVAPPFQRGADFAADKPARSPCPHLGGDFACGIHGELRDRGYPGCDVFECFGAGQQTVQGTFAGATWRDDPETRDAMFDAFEAQRILHECLWLLDEARELALDDAVRGKVAVLAERGAALTRAPLAELTGGAPLELRAAVGPLLGHVSAAHRATLRAGRDAPASRDLVGADLRGRDLRAADLRGALLLGARLSSADLRGADLLGTDLRGADLAGADLRGSLFLTPPQLSGALGDAATRLPAQLSRPRHWPAGSAA